MTRYLERPAPIKKTRVPVLSIQDSRLTKWNILTSVLAIWTVILEPYLVAFIPNQAGSDLIIAWQILIDTIYMIDIAFCFRTSFISPHTGEEIFEPKEIAKHYLLSGKFFFDIIAALPFEIILRSLESSAWKLSAFLQIIRIYRLRNLLMYMRAADEVKLIFKFFQLLLYLVLYVHTVGCLWFMLIESSKTWIPPTDIIKGHTDLYSVDAQTQYWFCFYHSVFLLVGVEIMASNANEYAFAVSFYICGAIITAIIVGEMAVISTSLSRKESRFAEIADTANTTMKNMKLPEELQLKIYDYLIATQTILELKDELEAFEEIIPPTVQQEVRASLFKGIVEGNGLFSTNPLLGEVITKMFRAHFYQPDEAVVSVGEDSSCMFFIASGKCEVEIQDEHKRNHLVRYLRPADYFGEIGLIYNTQRSATVKTSVYSSLANISKEDFAKLTGRFPELITNFKKRVSLYQDPYRCFLINCLNRIEYLRGLPSEVLDAVLYSISSKHYDANAVVLKEDDPVTDVLIVGEGALSISFKTKTRNNELLMKSVESQGLLRRRGWTILRSKNSLNWKLRNSQLAGFKHASSEHYVKLLELRLGGILGMKQALIQTSNATRVTAVGPTMILKINVAKLDKLAKSHSQLHSQLEAVRRKVNVFDRSRLELLKLAPLVDCLPQWEVDDPPSKRKSQKARILLQSALITVIKRNREIKMRGIPNISTFVARLKAIITAEDRGMFTIARDIAKGNIEPEIIDSADLLSINEITKPLLNMFAIAAKQVREMIDNFKGRFIRISNVFRTQQVQLEEFSEHLEDLRQIVQNVERYAFTMPRA